MDAKIEVRQAQQRYADEIDQKYPVGSQFRISWMHDSTPLVEVVRSMSRVEALQCKLLEDVPHRIAGKPPFRKAGAVETVSVDWIIS